MVSAGWGDIVSRARVHRLIHTLCVYTSNVVPYADVRGWEWLYVHASMSCICLLARLVCYGSQPSGYCRMTNPVVTVSFVLVMDCHSNLL